PPPSPLFPYTTLFRSPVALDGFDFVLLQQELNTLGELGHDLALALLDRCPVHGALLAGDAVFPGVLEVIVDLGGKKQGFRRNAADRKSTRLNSSHLGI